MALAPIVACSVIADAVFFSQPEVRPRKIVNGLESETELTCVDCERVEGPMTEMKPKKFRRPYPVAKRSGRPAISS